MVCILTLMCAATSSLVSWAMRPKSPGNAPASMRKLIWPSSWRLAMPSCAAIRLRSWPCMSFMACNRRPVSSLKFALTSLSSLPWAMASAARVARVSGTTRLRVINQASTLLISTTARPPPINMARPRAIAVVASALASWARWRCSAEYSSSVSCHACVAGAARCNSKGRAWSALPARPRSITCWLSARAALLLASILSRSAWAAGVAEKV